MTEQNAARQLCHRIISEVCNLPFQHIIPPFFPIQSHLFSQYTSRPENLFLKTCCKRFSVQVTIEDYDIRDFVWREMRWNAQWRWLSGEKAVRFLMHEWKNESDSTTLLFYCLETVQKHPECCVSCWVVWFVSRPQILQYIFRKKYVSPYLFYSHLWWWGWWFHTLFTQIIFYWWNVSHSHLAKWFYFLNTCYFVHCYSQVECKKRRCFSHNAIVSRWCYKNINLIQPR